MARISWERKAGTTLLQAGKAEGTGKDRVYSPFWRCQLEELFPEFLKYTEAQQMTIEYGVKQKLSDSIARPKDQKLSKKEVIEQFDETWALIVSGEWVKKVVPKTPLERAEAALKSLQTEMTEYQKIMLEEGTPKKVVESVMKKIFSEKLTEMHEQVKKLKKAEEKEKE